MAAVATQEMTLDGGASRQQEVAALCSGAATLSREGNRIAAMALLWAAVAIDPTDLLAHRRLAAALANGGDLEAAASEYARFIEFMLKQDDVRRAACELAYARSLLGDMPELRAKAEHVVSLGEVGRAFASPPRPQLSASLPGPTAIAPAKQSSNGHGPTAAAVESLTRPIVSVARRASRAHRHRRWRWLTAERADFFLAPEFYLILALATATVVVLVLAMERLR